MAEFIYTMKKARKAHGDKVILDDVTIMFYPGAKIGVVGPNGAGKSTVLQIMAGLQQPSNGEAYITPGYTVGILLQRHLTQLHMQKSNGEHHLVSALHTLEMHLETSHIQIQLQHQHS